MSTELILKNENGIPQYITADNEETIMLEKASHLMQLEFPDHALLELWNSSIHNLRRRIEMYSTDIFISTISSFSGRKNYKKDGDALSERWAGVDDTNLISGAIQIGVLNKKAGQALDMINWMRNHASPAHDSDDSVTKEDVLGLAILLQNNLFNLPLPDPAHSPVALLDPIKSKALTEDQIELFKEEINGFSNKDIRTIFGYSVDVIASGAQPAYDNISLLFDNIWDRATEELRTNFGLRIHNYMFDPTQDKSADNAASQRLYDMLLKVSGIKYIPDSTRATIYRKLAKNLAAAKNMSYGWSLENSASRALKQVGVHVPSIAFEDVYQEILSVWCGNYWGRSEAYVILKDFIFTLPAKQQISVAKLFQTNERVRDELYQVRPKSYAVALLSEIKAGLQNDSQITEVEMIINDIQKLTS